MKAFLLVAISFSIIVNGYTQSVGIGTASPHASAQLEVTASNKGMLVPRVNTAQRTAISSPATGLLVYDTDANGFWFYNGSTWTPLSATTLTLPYSGDANASAAAFSIRNTGTGGGIKGAAVTGPAIVAEASGSGLNGVAIKAENTNPLGIGLWSFTNSADANMVVSNAGSGDILRGFSGPGGGNLVFRVLNNGSITTTGNMGIGASAPTAKLEVNGAVKITDGTQGNRKLLTSDASGNASWAAPAGSIAFKAINFTDQALNINVENALNTTLKEFDLSNNLTASQFNVPVNGIYHFDIKTRLTANNADNPNIIRYTLRLKKNGSTIDESHHHNAANSYTPIQTVQLATNETLNAGDVITVTLEVITNVPTGPVYAHDTAFSGYRIY